MYYLIFSIFFAVYGGLNYYIGLRGWQFFFNKISSLNIEIYWVVFALVALTGIASTVANQFLPHPFRRTIYLAGSYWLAAMTYFILMILFFDLVRLVDSVDSGYI